MKQAIAFFPFLVFIPTVILSAPHSLDVFLPDDNALADWKRDTVENICSEWESSDFKSFYEIKDGGAEFYEECGFISGIYRGYINSDTMAICIDFYNFNIPENAKKVYRHPALDDGNFEYISSLGDSARFEHLFADYTLEVISGQYYMKLTTKAFEKYRRPLIDMAKLIVKQTPISYKNSDPVKKVRGLDISSSTRSGNILFTLSYYESPEIMLRDNSYLIIYDMYGRFMDKIYLRSDKKKQLKGLWSGKNSNGALYACGQYLAVYIYKGNTYCRRFLFNR